MLRSYHQADVPESGIRERAQHIVEKWPAHRYHGFHASFRDARLVFIERRAAIRAHALAEPARENDGFNGAAQEITGLARLSGAVSASKSTTRAARRRSCGVCTATASPR